jgi:hypothetical protein
MKRIILLAAFGAAGLVSANTSEVKEAKSSYYPITMTSSCGYTQTVDVGPNDQPDCFLTDLQQMEDECAAPFNNPMLGGFWP